MNISLLIYGVVLLLFILYVEKRFENVWYALGKTTSILYTFDKNIDELYKATSETREPIADGTRWILDSGKDFDSSETTADN